MTRSAAVIGAGFGGLALAIRLQSAGIATTVYEKRDKPGGRAYVYTDDGFTFDAGPTVITDPDCLAELWALSGRRLEDYVTLLPVTPFYQLCWEDGYRFDYANDQADIDRQIAAKSPGDVEGYRKFLAYSEDLYREGYEKLGTVPFLNFWSMIKAAPQLVRLESHRSVYSKVASFIEDDQLRQAFSFHSLLVGGNPFDTSSIYALIHALERKGGVWFAKGGTGALIQGMVKLLQDLGGKVHLNAEIDRIEAEADRVKAVILKDGTRTPFDMIASNADVVHTYKALLRGTSRGEKQARALEKKRFSMSLFVIYFGLSTKRPELRHHMVLFGPRYRELIREIFSADGLADDFSLYLHAPSVTDDSLAPEGGSAYYVLSPVPHLGTADIDWAVEGPKYRDRILDYLEAHYIPDLRRDLVTVRHFTPFDFRDELNAHLGSAFSVEPILTQSAWFRPHNRDDEISNLYIVGAGTHPGAGIPGVVGSAKATAGLMIEDAGKMSTADGVVTLSEQAIRQGSKSFAAAARLFDRRTRDDAVMLYAWCRHCDDVIDGQSLGHDQIADFRDGQTERLARLRAETDAALAGTPTADPIFEALRRVAQRNEIPALHPRQLLDGFEMDVAGRRYETLADTLDYGYHVAGVVGVMMAMIMGAREPLVLDRASDLGIAFQLTNIARDVVEDARAGRVYLPAEYLADEGITEIDADDPAQRAGLHRAALRLLDVAERYYASARLGMSALPPRSAWAIAAARRVYREIGSKLRAGGPAAWESRVSTSRGRKLALLGLSLTDVAASRLPAATASREGLYQRPL